MRKDGWDGSSLDTDFVMDQSYIWLYLELVLPMLSKPLELDYRLNYGAEWDLD